MLIEKLSLTFSSQFEFLSGEGVYSFCLSESADGTKLVLELMSHWSAKPMSSVHRQLQIVVSILFGFLNFLYWLLFVIQRIIAL